jgi:short-subunit dehydrogenase
MKQHLKWLITLLLIFVQTKLQLKNNSSAKKHSMQKVWITGASSGIGRALAIHYAKHHFQEPVTLALVARRATELIALQAELFSHYQVQSVVYALDVRDEVALKSAAENFIETHGAPNVVIASAGVSRGTLTEFAEDISAFQAVMDINVMGMVHTFQPFIQPMKHARKMGQEAQFVGFASVAGIRGLPGAGAYSASKAAVISYLESLRIEMADFDIAVTTIAPGYIRTPMTAINDYPMPFLMDAELAANKFARAIAAKRRYCVIPWQMAWVAKLMRIIPDSVWDILMKKAPHKKRVSVEYR